MNPLRKLRVFLCHSSQDKPIVRELYRRLNAEGWIDPWLDEEKLLPGQDWRQEIPQVVHNSDVVVVCLSKNSINKSGFVQKEIKLALDVADEKPDGAIFVIPARLEECEVPSRLSRWQWVNLIFDGKNFNRQEYERLLRSLQLLAERNQVILEAGSNIYSIKRESMPTARKSEKHTRKLKQNQHRSRSVLILFVVAVISIVAIAGLFSLFSAVNGFKNTQTKTPMISPIPAFTVAPSTNIAATSTSVHLMISEAPNDLILLHTLTGHSGTVFSVAFSPDNKILVTTANDGIHVWDVSSGEFLYQLLGVSLADMAFSPDGKFLAGVADGAFRIWSFSETGLSLVKENPIYDLVSSVAYSPDGNTIVTGSFDNVVRVWSADGTLIRAIGESWMVTSVAFSPDGKYIAVGIAGNGSIQVCRTSDWQPIYMKDSEDGGPIQAVAFLPNGQVIAVSAGGNVAVYEINGDMLYSFTDSSYDVWSVSISPDGKVFALAPLDTVVRVHNSLDGSLLSSLPGHTGFVRSVAFSNDGTKLATGTDDGSVRIWGTSP